MKNRKQGRILLYINVIAILVCIAFFGYFSFYSGIKTDTSDARYFAVAAALYAVNIIVILRGRLMLAGIISITLSNLLLVIFDSGKPTNQGSIILYIPLLLFSYVVTTYKERTQRMLMMAVTIACILLVNFTDLAPRLGAKFVTPENTYAVSVFNFIVSAALCLLIIRAVSRHNYFMEEELTDAKDLAEKSLKEKTRFLSIMSHEIRTPANAVVGLSHLLLEKGVPDSIKRDVQILHYSAQNMKALIDNILYYNSLEMGKVDMNLRPFDIRKFCHNAVESFVLEAAKKNINLHFEFDDRIPQFVQGDYEKLVLVLNNLLSNAIKFTRKGDVFLWVKMSHIDEHKCYILFKVADTGIGISSSKIKEIFNVFSQLDSKITRSYDGMGLGLSISRKLLGLMGSSLHVDSQESVGTTFYFEVGLGVTNEVKDDEQRFIETHDLKGIQILLVEDNKLNVLVAKKILNNMNGNVDVAKDGVEGLRMASAKNYDIILMDLHMPVMDGSETTRRIREKDKRIPVIAFTADAFEEARNRAKEVGMNDFISKPFDPVLLYNKIITNLVP